MEYIFGMCVGEQISMAEEKDALTEEEMYAILLKDFEEFRDEGRETYFEELIEKIRKDRESKENE